MGGVTNAITGMLARAKQDANLRRELQENPKQVLEREIGRKLSKEELTAALAELKKHGIENKPARS
jgi:hypothetical protein